MYCPLIRENCKAQECMFWRQEVQYDDYGRVAISKDKGYCGQIEPQDGKEV
jgi:hypothetical protein